ncbi:hypothetical protein DFR29_1071 [Tahibacter aquaticus]|uniref:HEAT repeat protein n=1 Tax=Tahibacter aquaticus TaxID=520092 RepID=A0A4R6YWE9_9GAMM|nr:hypothetical protein [Tahibacter aquaticus]TDR42997.1 hypothetical protein DFR29_1071 [Tahibacter aquaticus]
MNSSHDAALQKLLGEMAAAVACLDREAAEQVLESVQTVEPESVRVDVLNQLLLMTGHELHQKVAWEIQQLGSPSSVPFIRQVLERGFEPFDYTFSESGVIAKWFSHALAAINTPESIALIREFTRSEDKEVAEEMAYRLERLSL